MSTQMESAEDVPVHILSHVAFSINLQSNEKVHLLLFTVCEERQLLHYLTNTIIEQDPIE